MADDENKNCAIISSLYDCIMNEEICIWKKNRFSVLCFLFSVIGAESYLKPVDLFRVHVHINFTMTSIQY